MNKKQLIKENEELKKLIEPLISALEFYGDQERYKETGFWRIVLDEGRTARKALNAVKGQNKRLERF